MAAGKHGATTENTKAFIDFSAKNDIGAVLVEGWNTGWEHWIGFEDREGVFDFVTPYSDYDLKEVVRYGKEKGVEIIMHHEKDAGDFLHAGYDVEKCAAIAMRHDEIVWDLGNLLEGVFQLHTNSKIYFFDHDPGRTPKKVLSWKKDWIKYLNVRR